MRFFYKKLAEHLAYLNEKDRPTEKWTMNLVSRRSDVPSGHFSQWNKPKGSKGCRFPTPLEIERMSKVPDLELLEETLLMWRAIDEYGLDILEAAYEEAKKLRSGKK